MGMIVRNVANQFTTLLSKCQQNIIYNAIVLPTNANENLEINLHGTRFVYVQPLTDLNASAENVQSTTSLVEWNERR